MPLTVPCLKCKTKFQVPSKLAGTTVRCQACGFMLRLPSPEKIQAKKLARKPTPDKSSASRPTTAPQNTPMPAQEEFVGDFFEQSLDFGNAPAASAPAPAPEPTLLSCSHCQGLLYYDPNFANQTVACPHCGNHLVMPEL